MQVSVRESSGIFCTLDAKLLVTRRIRARLNRPFYLHYGMCLFCLAMAFPFLAFDSLFVQRSRLLIARQKTRIQSEKRGRTLFATGSGPLELPLVVPGRLSCTGINQAGALLRRNFGGTALLLGRVDRPCGTVEVDVDVVVD